MKVLLTGHRGYIGAVLTPLLLERGHEVYGLDADLFGACGFPESGPGASLADVPERIKDVRDVVHDDLLAADGGPVDAVIHLAGLSNDPLGDYRPELTHEINAAASARLARLAKAAGVTRFLFASSCSTYGAAEGDGFLTETGPFNPVTPYGASKLAVEHALTALADDAFSPTYLRGSTVYGLSPRIRFDLVVNNLAAWAVATGHVRLKSDGMPWRPITHVRDMALAYAAALEADRADVHCEAFNVGLTSENYRIREIAEIVHAAIPGSEISFAENAGPDARTYRVDCNFIGRKLHAFKPRWTCALGVEELVAAFTEAGVTPEAFEGERYQRIAHVKKLIRQGVVDADLRRRAFAPSTPERALERAL